jgi:hypothetical protein
MLDPLVLRVLKVFRAIREQLAQLERSVPQDQVVLKAFKVKRVPLVQLVPLAQQVPRAMQAQLALLARKGFRVKLA